VFAPVSGNCLAMDAFWWVVSGMQAHMGDEGDTHVKRRGEGVEDLVGAHVGVGVNDTLAAALHDVGYEGDAGVVVVECALPAASNAGCCGALGERFSRLDRLRRAAGSDCRLLSPDGLRTTVALAGPRATPVELWSGQLPIE
jgi:hypothetical protein